MEKFVDAGSYPAISLTVLLYRRISYHLLQTYVPSMLFVIVSWLSFLVPPESVPGRMAICMTTLLTLTAMFAAVRLVYEMSFLVPIHYTHENIIHFTLTFMFAFTI
jgi:hypothetical protein